MQTILKRLNAMEARARNKAATRPPIVIMVQDNTVLENFEDGRQLVHSVEGYKIPDNFAGVYMDARGLQD